MKQQNNLSINVDNLITNFDKALSHPNEKDLKKLEKIIKSIYS